MNTLDYVALDLETTGLDGDQDEIIEVALVRFINGVPTESMDALIKPLQEVRPFILNLTGIEIDELNQAETFEQVATKVRAFIGDLPLVAHNSTFDARFLRHAFAKCNIPFDNHPVLDSLLLSRIVWQDAPNHRLETLVKHLGIEREHSHRALPDAKACGILFAQSVARTKSFSPFALWHLSQLSLGTVWERVFVAPETPVTSPVTPAQSVPTAVNSAPAKLPERIKDWLGEQGLLSQKLAGYTVREGQNAFAGIVERNLFKGGIAVLEAGTGTGKTLGYLVPALLKTALTGERILISTSSKALQEQLWNHDLPSLVPLFGSAVKPALVKGRNNYLCLRKFHEHLAHTDTLLTPEERESFMPLVSWVQNTLTGDASENSGFNLGRNRQLWNKLQSDSSTCVGQECPHFKHCFGLGARRKAMDSNVVLVNHALFLQDLALDFALLPPYEHAIFDEAHRLPEISHETFGKRLWFFRFRNQVKILSHVKQPEKGLLGEIETATLSSDHRDVVKVQCESVRQQISECEKQLHRLFIKVGKGVKKQPDKSSLRYNYSVQAEFQADPKPALTALTELETKLTSLTETLRGPIQLFGLARDMDGALAECSEFRKDLEFVMLGAREDWAFWIEEPGNPHSIVFHAQPLNPGHIWATKFHPWIKSALFTSATLAVQGELDYYEWRMGLKSKTLPKNKIPFSRVIESPWNIDALRKVIIADFLPKPNDPTFQQALDQLLGEILPNVTQNTLALYTSINSLSKSHQHLSPLFSATRKPLFAQHTDGAMDNLVELFRKQSGACLMGTQMLWEGIDLPGAALEMLVIPKLPFPTPGDALVQAKGDAIRAKGGNSFKDLFVPEAILALRQGLGRLIRSESDVGTVLLLDNRLVSENYGKSFLRIWNNKQIVVHNVAELKAALNII